MNDGAGTSLTDNSGNGYTSIGNGQHENLAALRDHVKCTKRDKSICFCHQYNHTNLHLHLPSKP